MHRAVISAIVTLLLSYPLTEIRAGGPFERDFPTGGADPMRWTRSETPLSEVRRDIGRAERRVKLEESLRRLRRGRVTTRDTGSLPGYPLDIRGEDRVLGTGKRFARLGSMIEAAGTAVADGRHDNARALVDLATRRLRSGGWPTDDPNVAALIGEIDRIEARLSRHDR